MTRLDIKDIPSSNISRNKYDICIFGSGYEKRARYLLSKLYKTVIPLVKHRFCFVFNDYKNEQERLINDSLFKRNGFQFINVDSFNYGEISNVLIDKLKSFNDYKNKSISFLIDYTVMRRAWYSELLQLFRILSNNGYSIKATFVYTNGTYMGEKHPKIVNDYILVPGFEGVGSQKKEKYGIYTLGFEPITVQSLHDWVEPRKINCIIASPGSKPGSRNKCLNLNKNFLQTYSPEIFEIPISSVRFYSSFVTDLIKLNSDEYDIILFGGGPKPFILGNFLCSLLRPKISNIYLKGPESNPVNVESTGTLVSTEVTFFPTQNEQSLS